MISVVICMLPCRVWHLCNLQWVYALFRVISIARYALKSTRICYWGTKHEIYREHVACLHFILRRLARLWLELFASTVGRFLSPISYLSSETPWLYFEKAIRFILALLAAIWSSLCFSFSITLLVVLAPHDSNAAVYAQVCWLFCVLYMPLFGLGRTTILCDIMPTVRALLCAQFEQNLPVFTFMSTVWAKRAASSEQDGGRRTTTQDAFPDSSIQSLVTLFGFGVGF